MAQIHLMPKWVRRRCAKAGADRVAAVEAEVRDLSLYEFGGKQVARQGRDIKWLAEAGLFPLPGRRPVFVRAWCFSS